MTPIEDSMLKDIALILTTSLVLTFSLPAPAAEDEPPAGPGGEAGKAAEEPAAEEEGAEEEAAEKEPVFKKDTAKNDFIRGKVLFDEGKYKEAGTLFKKSKAEAKEKEDKALVDGWIQSAEGAQVIDKLKLLVKQNKKALAFEQAELHLKKYAKTPAEGRFRQFLNELEMQLLHVLQSFEVVSPLFSEKYGKTYVTDRKQVIDGAQCLRWTNTEDRKVGRLKIDNVPRDWRDFEAVEFHLNVKVPPASPEAVIFSLPPGDDGSKAKKKKSNTEETDFLLAPIRLPAQGGQWERVRIPLRDFKASGRGNLENVTHFQIQVGAGRAFEFLIDKVALVKKDTGPESAKAKDGGQKSGGKR
jgi:hypothetical protein